MKRRDSVQRASSMITALTFFVGFSAIAAPSSQPATSQSNITAAFSRGDYQHASQLAASAAKDCARSGDRAGEIDALVSLAGCYQAMGQVTLAMETLDTHLVHVSHPDSHHHAERDALSLALQLNQPRQIFQVRSAIAGVCMFSELSWMEDDFLAKADEAAQKLNDPAAKAQVAHLRAVMLAGRRAKTERPGFDDLSNYRQATDLFRDAIDYAGQANDPQLVARIALDRCVAADHNRQAGQDEKDYDDQAAKIVSDLPDSTLKIQGELTLGVTEMDSPDDEIKANSYAHLQKAKDLAAAQGDHAALSYAIGYTGTLYERQHRYDEALTLTRQAAFHAQLAKSPESQYRWAWQAGRILKAQGKRDEAIAAYQRALSSLSLIRNDISLAYGNMNMRSSFREVAGDAYYDLADLLIQRSNRNADDLFEAANVIEQLKTAELEDYFQDKCANLYREQQKNVREVAARNHAAIIYYIPLSDRLEILLMLPDGIREFRVQINRDKLMALAQQLHERLSERDVRDFAKDAKEAYRVLFAPMESIVAEYTRDHRVQTLVFVPDAALRSVPMAALMNDDGQFLVERYAISVSPGLQLMPPQPIPRGQVEVLANGLSEDKPNFPKLPNVPNELSSIQAVYGKKPVDKLLNESFTVSNLNNHFGNEQYSIVHIATHAEFSDNAHDTYLLTHESRLDLPALERLIEPSKFRGKPVELLSLSACHTAEGSSDRAALGLAGVAIKAGARSAMATLWEVDDQATTTLVASFYRHLHDDTEDGKPITKARALQKAQIELLHSKGGAKSHPYYWAPYLIIGNWL